MVFMCTQKFLPLGDGCEKGEREQKGGGVGRRANGTPKQGERGGSLKCCARFKRVDSILLYRAIS